MFLSENHTNQHKILQMMECSGDLEIVAKENRIVLKRSELEFPNRKDPR